MTELVCSICGATRNGKHQPFTADGLHSHELSHETAAERAARYAAAGIYRYEHLNAEQQRIVAAAEDGQLHVYNYRYRVELTEVHGPTQCYGVWTYAGGLEPFKVTTVEDYGTHYRVRGDRRHDQWHTVNKNAKGQPVPSKPQAQPVRRPTIVYHATGQEPVVDETYWATLDDRAPCEDT